MINDTVYLRKVFYYETDRMGIVHHSNYIRWMEEARLEHMRQNGVDYAEIEEAGILMPVTSCECEYKSSAKFGDTVEVTARLTAFNGVRAEYEYSIRLSGNERLLATGHSGHCFIDEVKRTPLNLKRRMPDMSAAITRLLPTEPA